MWCDSFKTHINETFDFFKTIFDWLTERSDPFESNDNGLDARSEGPLRHVPTGRGGARASGEPVEGSGPPVFQTGLRVSQRRSAALQRPSQSVPGLGHHQSIS